MKKLIALILTITMLAATVLTGCGSTGRDNGAGAANEPVTIRIWHDKEDSVAQVLVDSLSVLEPDIHIIMEKKEGMTDALKLVGNDPNSAPDMYFFAHDKIGVYAEMGILAPITDFLPEETIAQYMDATLDAATYKGELYQLPIYYETLLFMYNKALMSESDVPQTTEQLYNYMAANTDKASQKYAFVEQHSTAYYSIPWIHGFGGELIGETGDPLLTSGEVRSALEYHKKFLEYMPNDSEYSTVNTLFLEGKSASIIGGPWLVPTAREAGIDLGFATMPTVDETGLKLAPYVGVQGVHVLKVAAETKKDAITKVLEVIAQTDVGVSMANVAGCAPANSKCYEAESVSGDAMVNTMKAIADEAIAMPNIPEMDVMFVIAGNMLVAINMKGTDVEKATEDNQAKAQTLIEAMR